MTLVKRLMKCHANIMALDEGECEHTALLREAAAELERAQKDQRRYEWLLSKAVETNMLVVPVKFMPLAEYKPGKDYLREALGETIDRSIDAALRPTAGGGE